MSKETLCKLRHRICNELEDYVYLDEFNTNHIDVMHKLVSIIKNIDKIMDGMEEEETEMNDTALQDIKSHMKSMLEDENTSQEKKLAIARAMESLRVVN